MFFSRTIAFATSLILATGCISEAPEAELVPVQDLPWPTQKEVLPACERTRGNFVEPELAQPSGAIALDLATPWQPIGVDKRILVTVNDEEDGNRDGSANGALVNNSGAAIELIGEATVVEGRAELVVRVNQAGVQTLSVSLGDGRTGTAQIYGYATELPVWEMTIPQADIDRMLDNAEEKIYGDGVLSVEGVEYPSTMRLHGASSRAFPQKGWRFDLAEDAEGEQLELPDSTDHLILRAEWNDKALLRTFLAYDQFRNSTWLAAPKTYPVHFRLNGRFYGVMNRVERIDGDFLKSHGLNKNASLYEADPLPNSEYVLGANMAADPKGLEAYKFLYDKKKGTYDHTDLAELIDGPLQVSENLAVTMNEHIDVDSYLAYLAVMAVLQSQDHVRKNYYLYRDEFGADTRWLIIPWDMELTLGHLWSEANDVLEERIYISEPADFGYRVPYHDVFNQLITRMLIVEQFHERFRTMVSRVMNTTFNQEHIASRIENALCRMEPEILSSPNKRADNDEYLMRVDEIYEYVEARRAFLKQTLDLP